MRTQRSLFTRRFLWSAAVIAASFAGVVFPAGAQESYTLEQSIQTALDNNDGVKAAQLNTAYYHQLRKTSTDIGKLNAMWMHGQYNSIYQDNNFTITQSIPFPTVMTSLSKLGKEEISGAQKNLDAVKNDLVFEITTSYYQLLFLRAQEKLLESQDSLFADFSRASSARFTSGETNLLEKTTAETQAQEARSQRSQNAADIHIQQIRLQALLKTSSPVTPAEILTRREVAAGPASVAANPRLAYFRQNAVIAGQQKRVERNRLLPDLTFGFFNQSLRGVQNVGGQDYYYGSSKRFQGFQGGIAIPLWTRPQAARIKAYAFREAEVEKTADYFETTLTSQLAQAEEEIQKNRNRLDYYQADALRNASLILGQAKKSFAGGDIGYVEYLQAVRTGLGIRRGYLEALNDFNQSVIKLEYLSGYAN